MAYIRKRLGRWQSVVRVYANLKAEDLVHKLN